MCSSDLLRRAGLDYIAATTLQTHRSWPAFEAARRAEAPPPRLVLLTTAGATSHIDFRFRPDDILMAGRESEGVPDSVAQVCDARLRIPIRPGLRSLNVATALAIVLGEALRQLGLYPEQAAAPLREIDRKSTRLNSSHT